MKYYQTTKQVIKHTAQRVQDIEAMTPDEYKYGGKNLIIFYSIFDTRFGKCLTAATNKGVCNILFFDQTKDALADLKSRWPNAKLVKQHQPSHDIINKYFLNIRSKSKIKFHVRGTNFQIKVWEALLSIPPGKTTTYANIARQIGKPKAVRAVGTAVGNNPASYIIPCHRVLKSTGEIGQYHWGVEKKQMMLACEEIKHATKP
ncbi:MAG: methylated-DNA--[protein]-cysteine S-methyltransferase [Candidatus Magasanikbacteria bacterium]|nr:methylated-DNA--[protein]-cysteine S-methyltransferase [Candidatus Magasanikbacteria bacterium]